MEWIHHLILLATILIVLFGVSACSTIGKSRATLVLAPVVKQGSYSGDEFGELISESDKLIIRELGLGKKLSKKEWIKLVSNRYGVDVSKDYGANVPETASVSVSLRDRTKTPAFDGFSVDQKRIDDVTKLLLDKEIESKEKAKLLEGIRNNYATRPEIDTRVVFDRYVQHKHSIQNDDGTTSTTEGLVGLYRYFIELEVDLSGSVNSADSSTRFDYIATAIRIPKDCDATFINFSPKEADLFDLTVGNLKSSNNLTANAKKNIETARSESLEDKPIEGVASTQGLNHTSVTDFGLSFSLDEELAREIKTSLDIRSAGIYDSGKVFIIELRGSDLRRVSGTYSYKVMIEVQSSPSIVEGYGLSKPRIENLKLESRSIGVVRHVLKKGKSGIFKKIPEPLNDQSFHQVVAQEKILDAWKFTGTARGAQLLTQQPIDNLIVLTGYPQANYVVRSLNEEQEIIGFGSGKKSTFNLKNVDKFQVEFFPFVEGEKVVLEYSAKSEEGKIPKVGSTTVFGDYRVSRKLSNDL